MVSWAPPVNDGGSPLTGYTVTSSPGGFTTTTAAGETQAAMFGLANGVPYTFRVVAHNAEMTSAPSEASSPLTPFAGLLAGAAGEGIAWWLIPLAVTLASALVALFSVLAMRRSRENSAA